jgi:hypothetical protein
MSSASPSGTGNGTDVTYDLKFTADSAVASGGGLIINFCSQSPLLDTTCTTPTDMDVSGVDEGTVSINGTPAATNGAATNIATTDTVKWVANSDTAYSIGDDIELPLLHITNPSTTGTFYARVTSYSSSGNLATYVDNTHSGTYADAGSIALSTSADVGVTAYVLESMTFCVANVAPTKNCTGISGHNPSMTLGETVGAVTALTPSAVSHGDDYAQLSTNAIGGAVVNLKSSTTGCGGLVRNYGSSNCDITAQNTDGVSHAGTIAAGSALFGVKLGTAAAASDATGGDATGTLAPSGNYTTSRYFLDYVSGDATGVTSPFGSPVFNSNDDTVSNMNIPITFGASISNSTPAGIYGATLNMVATGTF